MFLKFSFKSHWPYGHCARKRAKHYPMAQKLPRPLSSGIECGEEGIASNGTGIISLCAVHGKFDVSIVTPIRTPRIFYQPERIIILCAVTNSQYSMIDICSTLRYVNDPTGIKNKRHA